VQAVSDKVTNLEKNKVSYIPAVCPFTETTQIRRTEIRIWSFAMARCNHATTHGDWIIYNFAL